MTAYFAYEKDFAGRWNPVAYFDSVPRLKKENVGNRSPVWPIDDEDMPGGEPAFGQLMAKHPAP